MVPGTREGFPSEFLHIGVDETFDLGAGQTAARVKQNGCGTVYVDFLKQIHAAAPPHKRLLFWGDMAMNEPEFSEDAPGRTSATNIATCG